MDAVEEITQEGAAEGHRTRLPIPLTSKRLTAAHLKRLATALGISTMAAGDKVRQMVEGRLVEQGREPRNMQVVLGATPRDAFCLKDADGTFLTVDAEEDAPVGGTPEQSNTEAEESGNESETLRAELEAVKAQREELREQVEQERKRFRELWKTNCQCLVEYDELIVQQEAEIKRLRELPPTAGTRPDSPVSDTSSHSHNGDRELPHAEARGARLCQSTRLQGRTLKCGWMTGCRHSGVPLLGMSGQRRSCYCSLQGTCVCVHCRSGAFWMSITKACRQVLLRASAFVLTHVVAYWRLRTFTIPTRRITSQFLTSFGDWNIYSESHTVATACGLRHETPCSMVSCRKTCVSWLAAIFRETQL